MGLKQAQIQRKYVILYKSDKTKANKFLNEFLKQTIRDTKTVAISLTNGILHF
ncbi:hypothetical protein [Campylobacter anatolicus]|uniref:hypothetical protein n=1 Tax=Campylobacter anatolicus TaxID=2829105 RepID=UPI001E3A3715|nr:hypothetical protein [Campylobacter anatolicus]